MLKKFISSKFFPSNLFKGRSNPTTANPVKKIKEDYSAELKEFVYLVRSEKPYFIRNCILSGITSGIIMLFPYALKGITHLASLRNTTEETETKKADDSENGIDDTQNPPEQKVKEKKSIFLPGDKISPEVKNEYLKFIGTWVPIFILSGILTYSRRFGNGDIANRIAYRLRYRIYSHLMSKDLNFFINQKSASTDYVHKLSNDVTTISNAIAGDLQFFLRGCMFAFGSTAYILINSPQLAIMSVAVAGSLAFSTRNILKKLRESKVKETEALTNLSIIAGERLSNMKLIKVNNTEEYEKKHYLHNLNKFYEESFKVQKYTAMNFGILDGLGQLSVISILTYGSFLITMGYASSEMIAFSMYALYAGMGFRGMFNTLTEMKKSAGLYKGIYDIIGSVKDDPIFSMDFKHFEKLMVEQEETFKLRKGEILDKPPRIEFKGVNFCYLDTPILKDLNLDIKPGSVVAITGASGSGKSTVLNLLTKLYEPDSGKIYINGREVSEIDPAWIRLNVSYVTQEPILFMGSIQDNIRYGNDNFDTSFENVVKAAKLADAHDFIMALPEQYNTKIGEKGMTLSGGQRQRIVLARALLKDPKILILDESTSALDAESEKSIIKGLSQMVKNRTCLIVTHKLESYQSIITDTVRL